MKKGKVETLKDNPSGVLADDLLPIIKRVQKEGMEDKSDMFKSLKRVYYWWAGAKDKIYTGFNDGDGISGSSSDNENANRHYPLLWSYVEVMKAILLDELKPLFVGKFRSGMEHLGDLGNATFEALRIPMKFDDAIGRSIENMILFYEGIIGPYVNYDDYFPDTVPGIRCHNPFEYFATRGRSFSDAPERLINFNLEKSELIHMFPEHADQIEKLQGWLKTEDKISSERTGDDKISGYRDLPGPWGSQKRVSENCLRLQELWHRDVTRHRISEEKNIKKAQDENDLFIDFLAKPAGAIPDTTMWLEDQDYHDNHIAVHQGWLALQENSVWRSMYPELAENVKKEMELHIEEHTDKTRLYPTERQGYVFKYSRGWRYSLVANQELLLTDGESPWLEEFGIVTPPFVSFSMCKDPLNVYGEPWAQRMVDLNANYSSFMNFIEDVFESRGDKLAVKPSGIEGGMDAITNHPREVIPVKQSESIDDVVKSLGGAKPPSELFHYMNELRSVLEQASGVHDPMLGKPGSNVRSAEQLRGLISQNEFIVNYHLKRILPAMKEFCVMTWQTAVGLGLDKEYLSPVINGILMDFELEAIEELENAPFTIEVKIRSSGLTTLEEKKQIVETVAPKMQELYVNVPGANSIIAKEIAEVYADDYPGIKLMVKRLDELQANLMQQANEQAAIAGEQGSGQQDMQIPPG